jgi:hypothetical protein
MRAAIVFAILVTLTAPASAQLVSETWTTFCDQSGNERVRSSFIVDLTPDVFFDDYWKGELYVSGKSCDFNNTCDGPMPPGIVNDLGEGTFEYVFDWPRECFDGAAYRFGRLFYNVEIEDHTETWWVYLECVDGPQTIIDNSDCAPVSVASSTWGAIKALFAKKEGNP